MRYGLQYQHASASPAAEAISDKGRPRRRSVKNRKSFDCFKSAVGIRFSVGARPTPKSFHRGTFWLHLLSDKRWKSCIKVFAVLRTARAAASAPRRPAIRLSLIHAVPAGCCPRTFPSLYLRLFRVAQFAAAPLRRTAVALRPPSANSKPHPATSEKPRSCRR